MAWQVSGYDYTYAAHRGAPSRNEISIPPNACGNLKTNKTRREAPRRNVMESKHTEAARPKGGGRKSCLFVPPMYKILDDFHDLNNVQSFSTASNLIHAESNTLKWKSISSVSILSIMIRLEILSILRT